MAFRPSKRRHKVESVGDLPLIPVMSLLVVLVPMLLQTAVFEQIAAVQLNLPSSDEVSYVGQAQAPQESVTVAVTDTGFQLISGEKTLKRIGLTPAGGLDYVAFRREIADAKKRFPRQEAIILLIEDGVLYDDIIHTMDECRPFFPGVSLADRVE